MQKRHCIIIKQCFPSTFQFSLPSPSHHIEPSETSVGAILLFLLACPWPCPGPSSFSLSLAAPASRFTPLTELAVLLGVWGGVVMDRPVAKLDVAAVMEGMLP